MKDKEIKLTKHEQDKQIVKSLPAFDKQELKEVYEDVNKFINEQSRETYFMLNSKELNYYTIFKRDNPLGTHKLMAERIMKFLTKDSFLTTLGELKVLKRHSSNTIEIWIGETHFMLFAADQFFVNV